MNLTGLCAKEDIIKELLLDSMIPSPLLPENGRYLDVGSGAGFPGIPMVICRPKVEARFVEANAKRADFLKHVVRLTHLDHVQIINRRIEQASNALHPEGYHLITARALAPIPQAMDWCCPHLSSGGLFVNFQGSDFKEVLKGCSNSIKENQLVLARTLPYVLPGGKERNILIFRKENS